jgi:DNA-binding NarL/FixJ family response regulator
MTTETTTQRQSIYLVDDHPLVREGLAQLVNQEPDFLVCGSAEDTRKAYADIVELAPDAAIIDLSLQGDSGLDLIKSLQSLPRPPAVLVLSMHDEAFYAERALRAGALGYVMKRETSGKVIAALRQVLRGEIYVSATIASSAAEMFVRRQTSGTSPLDCLTNREIEIFRLIGLGRENRRIAEELHVSLKTVQAHCANIKDKLGFENATILMREAVKWVESHV